MSKIAVAIIHGIGEQKPEFADEMITLIKDKFQQEISKLTDEPALGMRIIKTTIRTVRVRRIATYRFLIIIPPLIQI